MMAEHWRSLSAKDKAKYMSSVGSDSEDSDEELSAADKKRVAIRVAKWHQRDVSFFINLYSVVLIFMIMKANLLQSVAVKSPLCCLWMGR